MSQKNRTKLKLKRKAARNKRVKERRKELIKSKGATPAAATAGKGKATAKA